jgi:hypothetical protein
MNDELERLFAQIHDLEDEIGRRLDEQRARFRYRLAKGRAVFEAGVETAQRRLRTGTWRYIAGASLRHLVLSPVIYAMVIPLAVLDLSMTLYQWICFSAWGIDRVPRSRHIVLDRHRLAYLNVIEKLNCLYCGYGNGVLAYARDIAGLTEQYWCPIRHALKVRDPHPHAQDFVDYGDAEGFRARLAEQRARQR